MKEKVLPLIFALTAGLLFTTAGGAGAQLLQPGYVDEFVGKPRVVALSDIGNEPDDQMSFVRLLLYSKHAFGKIRQRLHLDR